MYVGWVTGIIVLGAVTIVVVLFAAAMGPIFAFKDQYS